MHKTGKPIPFSMLRLEIGSQASTINGCMRCETLITTAAFSYPSPSRSVTYISENSNKNNRLE